MNSGARAGGRACCALGDQGVSTALGPLRGELAGATEGDAERCGLGSEALGPGWLRPGTEPRGKGRKAAEQRGWRLQSELTQLQKPTPQLGKGVTKREDRTVGKVKDRASNSRSF